MNDENDIIYTQFKHGINNKNKNIETNPNANSKSIKQSKTKQNTKPKKEINTQYRILNHFSINRANWTGTPKNRNKKHKKLGQKTKTKYTK